MSYFSYHYYSLTAPLLPMRFPYTKSPVAKNISLRLEEKPSAIEERKKAVDAG